MTISSSVRLGSRKSISEGGGLQGLFVLAPVLLVVAGAVLGSYRGGSGREVNRRVYMGDPEQQSKAGHIKFQLVASGRAVKKGARFVSFNTYKSPDNILVHYSIESYDSEGSARAEMENMVKHATKIVERSQQIAPDGKLIGERAVLISACTPTAKNKETVVAWTDKATLAVLCSQSRRHALDFEQQVYHAAGGPDAK